MDSIEEIIYDVLMFGAKRPTVDLLSIRNDVMTNDRPGFTAITDPLNQLDEGYRFMLSLVKRTSPDKCLLKGDNQWNTVKVSEYLASKKRCLELLMLGTHAAY
jgi:hypothetical protein